jgi:putative ABC transport system permease protein
MNLTQIFTSLELGLIYSLVAMALYLSFRVINFPDLTVDGSFPLGAAIMAKLLSNGLHFATSLIIAMISGVIAGIITGYLHTKYKIMEILCGILTMTALYSINLRIMAKPNLTFPEQFISDEKRLAILVMIVIIVSALLIFFLNTQIGLALRATGQNPSLSKANGINTKRYKILGLAISNSLVSLGGALFAFMQGFADISIGTGTIIIGLASVIIGEKIINIKKVSFAILAVILGSLIYRFLVTTSLNISIFEPSDLNLISSLLVLITMIIKIKKGNS